MPEYCGPLGFTCIVMAEVYPLPGRTASIQLIFVPHELAAVRVLKKKNLTTIQLYCNCNKTVWLLLYASFARTQWLAPGLQSSWVYFCLKAPKPLKARPDLQPLTYFM